MFIPDVWKLIFQQDYIFRIGDPNLNLHFQLLLGGVDPTDKFFMIYIAREGPLIEVSLNRPSNCDCYCVGGSMPK